jgi:signal peptidase II
VSQVAVKAQDPANVSLTGRGIIFAVIASAGLLADLGTKEWIFRWRGLPGMQPAWRLFEAGGLFVGIETSVNNGALFGMGQGWTVAFVSLSIVAAIGIVLWLFLFKAARDWTLTLALALVLGGILGNLHDRLGLWDAHNQGALEYGVRDWILFRFRGWTWPNFNIADSLLVCGAGWLMWHSFWLPQPEKEAAPAK